MKSLMQIASECDMRYNYLLNFVQRHKIIPATKIGRRIFFDKFQEDYIHHTLYIMRELNEITLQSKMNYETM